MNYKFTPFNITATLLIILTIIFIVKAFTCNDNSMNGWYLTFALFSFVGILTFSGVDIIIQSFNIKHYWKIIIEITILVFIFIGLFK
jgi:succinate dehydrogenase hydrophobic anchor subunit